MDDLEKAKLDELRRIRELLERQEKREKRGFWEDPEPIDPLFPN